MSPEARVMFKLQQHKVVRKAPTPYRTGSEPSFKPVNGHQEQPTQVKAKLLGHCQVAVRVELRIGPRAEHDAEMIERPVKDVLAHVAPVGR